MPRRKQSDGVVGELLRRQYLLEYEPMFSLERDRREVARLIDVLGLPSGARLLDVPCGQGRHAHLLAEAGFDVDGLDYSAAPAGARARSAAPGRVFGTRAATCAQLPARWTGRFDAVLNLFTSFGFFAEPADDRRVIAEFARVLAPGGVLVWHGGNRDGVMARFLDRDWWQTERRHDRRARTELRSAVRTCCASIRSGPGRRARARASTRIRLYTPTRLAELCADVGLIVEQAYDGFTTQPLTRRSSEMLLVARKDAASRPLPRPSPPPLA